jgi:hypothetical protein
LASRRWSAQQLAHQAEHPQTTPPTGSATAGGGVDMAQKMKLLQDLAALKSQGILSEEEFQLEKRKILSS